MSEEVVPYTCDGLESRKRQKESLKAMRARLDEEERADKNRLSAQTAARHKANEAQRPRQHRKAA